MRDLDEMFYESSKRLEWYIRGINSTGLTPSNLKHMSTERIVELYNVEMDFFIPNIHIKRQYIKNTLNNKRQSFAMERAKYYLNIIPRAGNPLSCKAAFKYRQCWRIYRMCQESYCKSINIKYYE